MQKTPLSAKQLSFIGWLVNPDPDKGSQKAWAERNGLHPTSLTKWKQDPAFKAAWEKRHAEVSGGIERAQKLYEELYRLALGNVPGTRPADQRQAIMNYLEISGRYAPKKTLEIRDPRLMERSDNDLMAEIEKAKLKLLPGGKPDKDFKDIEQRRAPRRPPGSPTWQEQGRNDAGRFGKRGA